MVATKSKPLPIPTFFDEKNADKWEYSPDQAKVFGEAETWVKRHAVRPAANDPKKVELLLIDVQKDFCFPKGSLYVGGRSGRGALDDNRRTAEFIYRNLGTISEITCTMDTHFPFQIFFPSFWLDKEGNAVSPFRVVKSDEIKAGAVRPNPAVAPFVCGGNYTWLMDYVRHYCQSLEKAGKYMLFIWPYHCILGSDGHVLAGIVEEARLFHSFARKTAAPLEVKGGNLITENYSVLSPEVLKDHEGKPRAQKNTRFIKTLLDSDYVVIAGQAASHCVKSSIEDLLSSINEQDPKLVKKVYIVRDLMSAVTVPDGKGGFHADFTAESEAALKKFEDAGMHVVESTTPIEDWEGISL